MNFRLPPGNGGISGEQDALLTACTEVTLHPGRSLKSAPSAFGCRGRRKKSAEKIQVRQVLMYSLGAMGAIQAFLYLLRMLQVVGKRREKVV